MTLPALYNAIVASFDKNWSAPVADVICGKTGTLLDDIRFRPPDDGIFKVHVDAKVVAAFKLPEDAMLRLTGGTTLKLPDEGRTPVCSCGVRLNNPVRLFWRSKELGAAATGAI